MQSFWFPSSSSQITLLKFIATVIFLIDPISITCLFDYLSSHEDIPHHKFCPCRNDFEIALISQIVSGVSLDVWNIIWVSIGVEYPR